MFKQLSLIFSILYFIGFADAQLTLGRKAPNVTSHEGPIKGPYLFPTSISYCSPQQAVLAERANFVYFYGNNSLGFDIAGRSVSDNLSLSLDADVYIYGDPSLQTSISICDFFGGLLCPLPQYSLAQYGIFEFDDSLKSQIPSIGLTVPDLDATVRITLNDIYNHQEATCIQATIGNGNTTRQPQIISPIIGLLVLLPALLLVPLCRLVFPIPRNVFSPDWLFFLTVFYLQHIVTSSGLLSVKYPAVSQPFASNFAFMLGLIPMTNIVSSVIDTRNATGGSTHNYFQVDGQAIKSPYGIISENSPTKFAKRSLDSMIHNDNTYHHIKRGLNLGTYLPEGSGVKVQATHPLPEPIPTLRTGLSRFADIAGISPSDVYMTSFIVFLVFLAIVIGIGLLFALGSALSRSMKKRLIAYHETTANPWVFKSPFIAGTVSMVYGLIFRGFIASYFPMCIFTFYTWTITSDLSGNFAIAVSGICIIIMTIYILACIYWIFTRPGRPTFTLGLPKFKSADNWLYKAMNDDQYFTTHNLHIRGYNWWRIFFEPSEALCSSFKSRYWWFFLAILSANFVEALFVGFSQENGTVQAICLLALSAISVIVLSVYRPFRWTVANAIVITLYTFRMISHILVLIFIPSISAGIKGIPLAVVGFINLAVYSIGILILFVTIWAYIITGIIYTVDSKKYKGGLRVLTTTDDGTTLVSPVSTPSSSAESSPVEKNDMDTFKSLAPIDTQNLDNRASRATSGDHSNSSTMIGSPSDDGDHELKKFDFAKKIEYGIAK